MRICFFGTYDRDYVRNRNLIDGLACRKVEVCECHAPLWLNTADKIEVVGQGLLSASFLRRVSKAYSRLLSNYRDIGPIDAFVVGYIGYLDMFLARFLARRRRVPLVFDPLMSISLIAHERGLAPTGTLKSKAIAWLERAACRRADMIWLDTRQHIAYFERRHGVPREKCRLIPLGADDRFFYPVSLPQTPDLFKVVYVGKYVPLHGVEIILRAAAQLRDLSDVQFEFIGEGQTKFEAMTLAKELELSNVTFQGWVDKGRLAEHVADAAVYLGVFGQQTQAQITVPNKIFEGLACRKAVITGASPAVKEFLSDGEHILLSRMGDPAALADAIRRLYNNGDLRQSIADTGYRLYRERFTLTNLGALAEQHLRELLGCGRSGQVHHSNDG